VFYETLESAFEALAFSLLAANPDFLTLSQENMTAYLEGERINIVVHAHSESGEIENLQRLINICGEKNLPVIHISSYRVFGRGQGELSEYLLPEPDDLLGNTLLASENVVLGIAHAIVLRAPWTLTSCSALASDEGLLGRICFGLLNNSVLNVSEVAAGTLISWSEMAKTIVAIVQQILCGAENWGIFHVHTSDACSEAEFADAVARLLRGEGFRVADLVITKDVCPASVERAALLRGRRCTDNFGVQQRSFRVGLKGSVQRWIAENGYTPAV
jgi:dTDP-4-dehydrorhamnose reductase